jgi:hypothetical protein
MNKVTSLASALLLIFVLGATGILLAKAQSFEIITIKSDGRVDPETAPLIHNGNIYTLTKNISGNITIERNCTVIEGSSYTIQGEGSATAAVGIKITAYNVTVRNINIIDCFRGIQVDSFSGSVIAKNNVTNNQFGVMFTSYSYRYANNVVIGNMIISNDYGICMSMNHNGDSSGNIFAENQIANNRIGIGFGWLGDYYSWKPNPFYMNNTVYYNNFINNSQNVETGHMLYSPDCINNWDNGSIGNYWTNYNGSDTNLDGIGDSPYVIDGNNLDHYPLMTAVSISSILPYLLPSTTPFPSPSSSPSSLPTPSPSPLTSQYPTLTSIPTNSPSSSIPQLSSPSNSASSSGNNSGSYTNPYLIGGAAIVAVITIISLAAAFRRKNKI